MADEKDDQQVFAETAEMSIWLGVILCVASFAAGFFVGAMVTDAFYK